MPKFYHVLAQGQAFGLQLNQYSQPFDYLPQFFAQHFVHNLNYPIFNCRHPSMCVHTSHHYALLHYVHSNKRTRNHETIHTPLSPLHKMLIVTWDENNYMHFLQPHSTLLVNESTLCLLKMAFTPQPTLSLLTQHEWIHLPNLAQFKDLLPPMQLKPRRRVITIDTPLINAAPQQLKYLVAYTNMPMCFYTTMPMPFGVRRGQKAFIFLPWSLFFIKKFRSYYKGCKHLPF